MRARNVGSAGIRRAALAVCCIKRLLIPERWIAALVPEVTSGENETVPPPSAIGLQLQLRSWRCTHPGVVPDRGVAVITEAVPAPSLGSAVRDSLENAAETPGSS